MKIAVLSDSHGCNNMIDYVLDKEKDAKLFLHCGDICVDEFVYPELITVCGNNDYYDYPMQRVLNIGDHRIIMFHSHQFPFYKKEDKMIQRAKEYGCDILLFGHTHIPYLKVKDGITLLNPGSLYHNRDGSKPSYAVMNINGDKVDIQMIYIDESEVY